MGVVCGSRNSLAASSGVLVMIQVRGGSAADSGVRKVGRTGLSASLARRGNTLTIISPVITSSSHQTSISFLVILPIPSERV